MNTGLKRVLYWTPRILLILLAIFVAVLLTLSVFGECQERGDGFWKTILYLLVANIPTYIMLGTLAISWRREWVAAALFIAVGLFGLVRFGPINAPLVLIGVLFLLNWRYRDQLGTR